MFKKSITFITLCALLAVSATGCASASVTSTEYTATSSAPAENVTELHTHIASGEWDVNAFSHWRLCDDCGEKTDEGSHTLDDTLTCTVCGREIIEYDDGTRMVCVYTDNGEPLVITEYAPDGELVNDVRYEYEYDDNGCVLKSKETINGVTSVESEYIVVDGESVCRWSTGYMEDGAKFTDEYDTDGNIIKQVYYNADGTVDTQMEYEYVLLSEGFWHETKCTETLSDGSVTVIEYNEWGDIASSLSYDAEGALISADTWEYTYDDDGKKTSEKSFTDGVLTSESTYKNVELEDVLLTYADAVTEYAEDGSRTVTTYDENGTVIGETQYDADGELKEQ